MKVNWSRTPAWEAQSPEGGTPQPEAGNTGANPRSTDAGPNLPNRPPSTDGRRVRNKDGARTRERAGSSLGRRKSHRCDRTHRQRFHRLRRRRTRPTRSVRRRVPPARERRGQRQRVARAWKIRWACACDRRCGTPGTRLGCSWLCSHNPVGRDVPSGERGAVVRTHLLYGADRPLFHGKIKKLVVGNNSGSLRREGIRPTVPVWLWDFLACGPNPGARAFIEGAFREALRPRKEGFDDPYP